MRRFLFLFRLFIETQKRRGKMRVLKKTKKISDKIVVFLCAVFLMLNCSLSLASEQVLRGCDMQVDLSLQIEREGCFFSCDYSFFEKANKENESRKIHCQCVNYEAVLEDGCYSIDGSIWDD